MIDSIDLTVYIFMAFITFLYFVFTLQLSVEKWLFWNLAQIGIMTRVTIILLFLLHSYILVVRSFSLVRLSWNEIRVTPVTVLVVIRVDERYHKSHHEETTAAIQVLGQISYRGLLEDHSWKVPQ